MMELKITADERTLEALEGLTKALNAYMTGKEALPDRTEPALKMPACEEEEYATPPGTEPAPQEEPPAPEEAPISAEDVKRQAIRMIQGGQRDAVKGLLEKYGVARVTDVTDEKLADFKKDLDSLK